VKSGCIGAVTQKWVLPQMGAGKAETPPQQTAFSSLTGKSSFGMVILSFGKMGLK
jgi:hypothetical protein